MRLVPYAALVVVLALPLPAGAAQCERQKLASPDGPGMMIDINCRRLEGEFRDGLLSGHGKITGKDGMIEEGNFVRGRLWGAGKLVYSDGRIAEGEFVDGRMNGLGKLTWPDGRVHEGLFFNGLPAGPGRYRNARGELWEGMFNAGGYLDGRGIHTLRDGTRIIGEFREDRQVGEMTIEKPDGTAEVQPHDMSGRKTGKPTPAPPAASLPEPAAQAAPSPAPAIGATVAAAGQMVRDVDRARGLRAMPGR